MSEDAEVDLAGRRIGHYRILERIGRGGMGDVYKGYDVHLDRPVAIKVVRPDLVSDPQVRRRFRDEAKIASRIVHPHVATVFDVVEHEDTQLLVMEFIEGHDLGQVLREQRPDPQRVLRLMLEITEGLAAVHEKGLIHRDLKPGNVMIGHEGHAKLMDLGLASMSQRDQQTWTQSMTAAPTVSTDQSLRGTRAYMSPEQLRLLPLDQRSDLFALGMVLYETISGEHPFHRGVLAETISSILSAPPGLGLRPRAIDDAGALGLVALKLLEKDPADRYQSTAELLADLEALQQGSTLSLDIRVEPARRQRRRVIAGSAVVAVALVAALAWRAFGPADGVGSRPAVAVLPLVDLTGDRETGAQRNMIADVLATQLSESRSVRSVPLMRVQEILDTVSDQQALTERMKAVVRGVGASWLLAGKLYREGSDYVCTFVLYRRNGETEKSFSVRGALATEVARRAAIKTEELIVGRWAGDLKDAEARFVMSESDEAQQLYQRAQELERELRYAESIRMLENSLALDPEFARASLLLSDLLQSVGF